MRSLEMNKNRTKPWKRGLWSRQREKDLRSLTRLFRGGGKNQLRKKKNTCSWREEAKIIAKDSNPSAWLFQFCHHSFNSAIECCYSNGEDAKTKDNVARLSLFRYVSVQRSAGKLTTLTKGSKKQQRKWDVIGPHAISLSKWTWLEKKREEEEEEIEVSKYWSRRHWEVERGKIVLFQDKKIVRLLSFFSDC